MAIEDPRVVVVVPTLNEEAALPDMLDRLGSACSESRPVVIADCGSSDRTASIARKRGCYVVSGPTLTGRGAALRAGAAFTLETFDGVEAIWLLHADTFPPDGGDTDILEAMVDPTVAGGAFSQRFELSRASPWAARRLRMVSWFNRLRYRASGTYFGDQGLFVRASLVPKIGGLPGDALFEDIRLCRALKAHGRLLLLPGLIHTSPRRFLHNGIERQVWTDWALMLKHKRQRLSDEDVQAYNRENRGNELG